MAATQTRRGFTDPHIDARLRAFTDGRYWLALFDGSAPGHDGTGGREACPRVRVRFSEPQGDLTPTARHVANVEALTVDVPLPPGADPAHAPWVTISQYGIYAERTGGVCLYVENGGIGWRTLAGAPHTIQPGRIRVCAEHFW